MNLYWKLIWLNVNKNLTFNSREIFAIIWHLCNEMFRWTFKFKLLPFTLIFKFVVNSLRWRGHAHHSDGKSTNLCDSCFPQQWFAHPHCMRTYYAKSGTHLLRGYSSVHLQKLASQKNILSVIRFLHFQLITFTAGCTPLNFYSTPLRCHCALTFRH